MYIPKYRPPHTGGRALDKPLSTLLVYLESAIRLDEQLLLDARTQPCDHCDSSGKTQDTFDKMCEHCTPAHCAMGARTDGLSQIGSFSLCQEHLTEERRES